MIRGADSVAPFEYAVFVCHVAVPPAGSAVPKGQLRHAGPYLLGPRLGTSPVCSIVQCLARKQNTG